MRGEKEVLRFFFVVVAVVGLFVGWFMGQSGGARITPSPVLRTYCCGVWVTLWDAGNQTRCARCKASSLPAKRSLIPDPPSLYF